MNPVKTDTAYAMDEHVSAMYVCMYICMYVNEAHESSEQGHGVYRLCDVCVYVCTIRTQYVTVDVVAYRAVCARIHVYSSIQSSVCTHTCT